MATVFLTCAWSGTNEVFTVLIDGGPRWLGHKRTYAINDLYQYISPYKSMHNGMCLIQCIVSLSDSLCSAKQGVKEFARSLLVHVYNY